MRERYPPYAEDYCSIWVDPHQFVWHCDIVKRSSFLVWKEQVGCPYLAGRTRVCVELIKHHPVVGPDLPHVNVHCIIL